MEVNNPTRLLLRIQATLVEFGSAGAPSEKALLLPVFDKPPTCSQLIPGHEGNEVFSPETLGAACIVSKGTAGVNVNKTNNAGALWKLSPGGGNSAWETDVRGLRQTHCTFKPCKGQPKTQFNFTPYKFELMEKTTAPGLYLVVNMQRRTPMAPTEEQEEAAASAMAGEGITPPRAPALLPTCVAFPEPTTTVDAAEHTLTDAPPTPPLAAGSETTRERPESPEQVTGLIERLSLAGAASNSDGGEGGGVAGASGGGAACAKCGTSDVKLTLCTGCRKISYCGLALVPAPDSTIPS